MKSSPDEPWSRYGRALIDGMGEVLQETPEEMHANLLETADYWLSLGLAMALSNPGKAADLLGVIEAHEAERGVLDDDARELIRQVFHD